MISDIYWGISEESEYSANLIESNENKKRKHHSIDNNLITNSCHTLNDPLIYTFGKEVHFTAGINKFTIENVIKQISAIIHKYIEEYTSRGETLEITYVIDSPGGSCTSILKFVDFLELTRSRYSNIKFKSVISGLVASAGTIMACVADERLMTSNAKSMIHDLSGNNGGTYTQMMSQIQFIKDLNESLVNIYLKKSNKTKEELTELLKTNKWFNANEYLEYGFVDRII